MEQKVGNQVSWIFQEFLLRQNGHGFEQELFRDEKRDDTSNDLTEGEQTLEEETYLKRKVYLLLPSDIPTTHANYSASFSAGCGSRSGSSPFGKRHSRCLPNGSAKSFPSVSSCSSR